MQLLCEQDLTDTDDNEYPIGQQVLKEVKNSVLEVASTVSRHKTLLLLSPFVYPMATISSLSADYTDDTEQRPFRVHELRHHSGRKEKKSKVICWTRWK